MQRGEIVLDHATRTFRVRPDRSRTLKELFVHRGHASEGTVVRALDDVTLRVEPGEAVGLVGRNGAGKTSTLRCLAGIVPLDSGRAGCGGRIVSLLELGAGFGPEFSGRENIYLNGALHGFRREEIEARVEDIIAFSELGDFIEVPIKTYSTGMELRLGFAIAAHLDADVMLFDEILAVGDESFQRKCLARISERMEAGATLILVSHDPSAIERICRRVVVLDHGKVEFDGDVADGLLFYHRLLGGEEGRSRSLRPGERATLEVLELELQDADGNRRSAFRPGEALRVEMVVAAGQPADRAVMALEVRDGRGGLCFRTDTTLGEVSGQVGVSFEIPRLNLLGGDYDVVAGAFDQDAPPGGRLSRLAKLSVAHSGDGEGIADLRGEWSVGSRQTSDLRPQTSGDVVR
jgi:ABC-type polysaccharide/polyol phosphate transport system ATPase subunit